MYKWDSSEKHLNPETGLLNIRAGLSVFANLRPATVLPQVYIPILFQLQCISHKYYALLDSTAFRTLVC